MDRLFRRYAEASFSATPWDAKVMPRLCEIGKQYLQQKAKELVISAGQSPVLSHYAADGTPLSTKKTVEANIKKGLSVRRYGRETDEFLIQHAYYRTLAGLGGDTKTTAILRDPLPMTQGKSSLATFSAFQEFFRTTRQLGHRGICIAHYSFDRALFSSMSRLLKQFHKLQASQFRAPELGRDHETLELLEWIVSSGCALHDSHNSLKWAMHGQFNDPELLQDVFVVVASAKNSFGLLCDHLGPWMCSKLSFVPDDSLPPAQDRYELWTSLGVETELAETLAFELRLQWQAGRLEIAASCADSECDLVEKLSGCMLALWEFRQFTASRWATVGTSCRGVVAAILTGFSDLVQTIRSDPRASDYHISGYGKLTNKVKQFVGTAAMAAYVCDAFLLELMADSRVPLRLRELEDAMNDEMRFLANTSDSVWAWLGEALDICAATLRSDVLAAGHTTIGFIATKSLSEAKKLPWSLGCGDVDLNLDELIAGAEPAEPTAAKIYRLLRLGFNRLQIKQALSLLMDAPWGTQSVEQGHASATLVKKVHPEFSKESLMLRAFFHSFRKLLPSISDEDKKLVALGKRVNRLLQKSPDKVTGRHIYLQDLMALAGTWKAQGTRSMPSDAHKTVMQRHAASWANLPSEAKAKYEKRAALARSASNRALQDELAVESQQLALAKKRRLESETQRPPLALSQCRLTVTDVKNMQDMACSSSLTDKRVSTLRKRAQHAPDLPSADMVQALQGIRVYEDKGPTERPDWLGVVCWNRAFFHQAALAIRSAGGQLQYYKFLFATQKPLFVCFSLLELIEVDVPVAPMTRSRWAEYGKRIFRFTFEADFTSAVAWYDLPPASLDSMSLLTNLCYSGASQVSSDAEPMPFPTVLSWLPKAARKERVSQPNPKETASRDNSTLLAEHPYLKSFLAAQVGEGSSQSSDATPANTDPAVVEPLDDDALQELFSELERKRLEYPETPGFHGEFLVSLLGGKWAMDLKGVPVVAFQGKARLNSQAESWCIQYDLHRTARFEISMYGEQVASALAHGWCDRMSHFFRLWENSGQQNYKYTAEDVSSYQEPQEMVELATILTGAPLARLNKMRALRPM